MYASVRKCCRRVKVAYTCCQSSCYQDLSVRSLPVEVQWARLPHFWMLEGLAVNADSLFFCSAHPDASSFTET